jgi:hypothetical protein
MNTKAVDKVHDIVARKMLAVTMALLRTDKLLENASDDVGGDFAEIDGADTAQ